MGNIILVRDILMTSLNKVVYPKAFKTKYIKIHWDFEQDLKLLLERSGLKEDFWGKYLQRLRFLEDRLEKCITRNNWFEQLKNKNEQDTLYAMRFNK